MAGTDKSTQRVIAVIALLVAAAWALRGHVPGSERIVEREPTTESPAALAAVVAILCAAVAIIGYAIVVRMRAGRTRRAPSAALPRSPGAVGRPTWRFSLIALGAIVIWLLLTALLARIDGLKPPGRPAAVPPAAPEAGTAPSGSLEPARPPVDPGQGTDMIDYLIPPMLVLMTLIVVVTAIASHRQRRAEPQPLGAVGPDDACAPGQGADSLARAAEIGLAEIGDLSREPREAIIACYAAMETELTRVPGAVPQDFDTPSEVLARAVHRGALRADSATELVELFEEARFSPHVMTEAHRDSAVRVLRRVLAEIPQAVT
ncbi:DUF4129 domain-containing protein [Mycolicibacterium sp. XJ1819]